MAHGNRVRPGDKGVDVDYRQTRRPLDGGGVRGELAALEHQHPNVWMLTHKRAHVLSNRRSKGRVGDFVWALEKSAKWSKVHTIGDLKPFESVNCALFLHTGGETTAVGEYDSHSFVRWQAAQQPRHLNQYGCANGNIHGVLQPSLEIREGTACTDDRANATRFQTACRRYKTLLDLGLSR
jgi:hypothetical protein